jgi:hypothetical protein
MATTANKTEATATPLIGSTKTEMAAEVAKATTTPRKGIELVAKVEAPKKTKAAAKPHKTKTATKKDSLVAISRPAAVSRESIEQLAYQFWAQRGYQHGNALQDWLRAEQELGKL